MPTMKDLARGSIAEVVKAGFERMLSPTPAMAAGVGCLVWCWLKLESLSWQFIAMLLFVYFGCGAASSNAHWRANGEWDSASVTIIALQFGLGITCLAYATAHSSGGHINCAVTWALTIVGTCHPARAVSYVTAQLLGSIWSTYAHPALMPPHPNQSHIPHYITPPRTDVTPTNATPTSSSSRPNPSTGPNVITNPS